MERYFKALENLFETYPIPSFKEQGGNFYRSIVEVLVDEKRQQLFNNVILDYDIFSSVDDNPRALYDQFPGIEKFYDYKFVFEVLKPMKCLNTNERGVDKLELYRFFTPINPVLYATILAMRHVIKESVSTVDKCLKSNITTNIENGLLVLSAWNDVDTIKIIELEMKYFEGILENARGLLENYAFKESNRMIFHERWSAWMLTNPVCLLGTFYLSIWWWYVDMNKIRWNDLIQGERLKCEQQLKETNRMINLAIQKGESHMIEFGQLLTKQKCLSLKLARNKMLYEYLPEEIHADWIGHHIMNNIK